MIVVKEDQTYLVLGQDGRIGEEAEGVYRQDTRMLSRWRWTIEGSRVLAVQTLENSLRQHVSCVNARRFQEVGLDRCLTVRDDGFDETWTITSTSQTSQSVTLSLEVEGQFRDLFAVWAEVDADGDRTVRRTETQNGLTLSRTASDGVSLSADVTFAATGQSQQPTPLSWTFDLAPGQEARLLASVKLSNAAIETPRPGLPSYSNWRGSFDLRSGQIDRQRSLDRAVDDLRMLLLSTEQGPYPAAGLPWFSCIFGRDALIASHMLLGWRPDVCRSVLDRLAFEQGQATDVFREEEPGKIIHEARRGELSRIGKIPFGRYYGSVDATPLFVSVLGDLVARTGDTAQVGQMRHAWEPAIHWLEAHRAETGDLVAFAPSGSGLAIQSWKDSPDSMNHADGTEAEPPLAVAEVQGYALAAFRTAAGFYRTLGDEQRAADCDLRAHRLAEEFHSRFWIEDLGVYALALDRHGKPLRVRSSDPGHLLWSGAVPEAIAPRLVETMMGSDLWSGWGLRTLGAGENRFNAVSYHNGSVWPHDTALFAGGLARYGFEAEAETVATALLDLAASQPLNRLPELVSGFRRAAGLAPIPYTHSCKPQAWAAAGLLYAARVAGVA